MVPVIKAPRGRRAWPRKLAALALGCAAALALLEGFVRVYPPFDLRIRGSRLLLTPNCRRTLHNDQSSKLDREITYATNSLGFRGADPPADFAGRLSIVAVGGSTTECRYLDESKTWPARLAEKLAGEFPRVWLNNAGLDGHSTRGHRLLLDQLVGPLRPKLVLYLVGVNDVGLAEATPDDAKLVRRPGAGDGWVKWAWLELLDHSALCAMADNLRRHWAARRAGLTHGNVDHVQLRLDAAAAPCVSEAQRYAAVERHRRRYVPAYERRLGELVLATRHYGSRAVLITQPALYGDAIDDETGVDLARVKVGQVDGLTQWQVLETYNDGTRRVAGELGVHVIDLAAKLPKTSRYYYDYHHFTNEGAEAVAEIVNKELGQTLNQAPLLQAEKQP